MIIKLNKTSFNRCQSDKFGVQKNKKGHLANISINPIETLVLSAIALRSDVFVL